MSEMKSVPSVSVSYAQNGNSTKSNELGMRAMQERAYEKRGEQYLLIKSPPASGKSRALMFIALDKLHNQGIKQAIIVVPERSIGSSFANEPLSQYGFWSDWSVEPCWDLCKSSKNDDGKVKSFDSFLQSEGRILICTHSTFRASVDKLGVEMLDDRLIAIDEFHHASMNPDNKLGAHVTNFIRRNKVHIVAMTGSYFRGDSVPVLSPEDEAIFETVTYTYYEQLNGYEHLKKLDIGYYFYSDTYMEDLLSVLDPEEKTIIHIPHVNSRAALKEGKYIAVEHIMDEIGEWQGIDENTGFQLIKSRNSGRILKIADLVTDGSVREKVITALKDPLQKNNRSHVDVIIALGMAKEGFDWIWCEHALTIGYRESLTEVVQIIGRATRDAKGKKHAKFSNLIAEPVIDDQLVAEAVNDTLKAISASLLMEQVLIPRFNFRPKSEKEGPKEGFDYGGDGYQKNLCNVGYSEKTGQYDIEIKGLKEPASHKAKKICKENINDLIAAFIQDDQSLERGIFDRELVPQELTQLRLLKIINEKYPDLEEQDQEAVREHAITAINLTQSGKKIIFDKMQNAKDNDDDEQSNALVAGIRKFVLDVKNLDIDLIDSINPYSGAYSILSKTMNEERLKAIASLISGKKIKLTADEAVDLAERALTFKQEKGRLPNIESLDPWEKKMAEGVKFLQRMQAESGDE